MAFAYYSPLTIDHTKVPNSNQTDFPVLVSLTDARLKSVGNGGHVQSANGYDIRPYTDSGLTTAITGYELESYDASAGTLLMWVKISSLSHSTDTVFYLAYGDSGLSSDGSSTGTWDSYYAAVYHFGDGTTLSGKDSTSHGIDLTNHSVTAHAGMLAGGSGDFNGAAWMESGNTIAFASTDHVTFQAWVKSTALDSNYHEIIRMSGAGGIFLIQGSANKWSFTASGGSYDHANAPAGTTTGNHLLVGVFDGTNTQMYIDGVAAGTSYPDTPMPNVTAVVALGTVSAGGGGQYWSGLIDEARISKIDRSADWIATEYHNQNSPSTFFSVGAEQSTGGVANYVYAGTLTATLAPASKSFQNRVYAGSHSLTLAPAASGFQNRVWAGAVPLSLAVHAPAAFNHVFAGSLLMSLGVAALRGSNDGSCVQFF